jgi:hypothetical protein
MKNKSVKKWMEGAETAANFGIRIFKRERAGLRRRG